MHLKKIFFQIVWNLPQHDWAHGISAWIKSHPTDVQIDALTNFWDAQRFSQFLRFNLLRLLSCSCWKRACTKRRNMQYELLLINVFKTFSSYFYKRSNKRKHHTNRSVVLLIKHSFCTVLSKKPVQRYKFLRRTVVNIYVALTELFHIRRKQILWSDQSKFLKWPPLSHSFRNCCY